MDFHLNVRPETIKSLEEKLGGSSLALVSTIIFSFLILKTQAIKAKIHKFDHIKLENFWTVKETIKK